MAMHCPQCLTEYRDGFSECSDCHVALAPGLPPAASSAEHEVALVTVLEHVPGGRHGVADSGGIRACG
jgi:hypothetical protein